MGWELRDFRLEQTGGLASPFQFEVLLNATGKPSQVVRGDGIVIREQTVRFNRPEVLARHAQAYGLSPDGFIASLKKLVTDQTHSLQPTAA